MLGYRKPMSPISRIFVLFFLSVHIAIAIAIGGHEHEHEHESQEEEEEEVVKLDLMHRHHPKVAEKLYGEVKVQGMNDRLKDIHEHDHERHRIISATLNRKRADQEVQPEGESIFPPISPTPIGLKMISGSDFGTSEYFVQLKIGTPPQTFMLIADTGSDLTWVKCRYRRCIGNCSAKANHKNKSRYDPKQKFRHPFLANHSSSFRTFTCSSKTCSDDFSGLFSIRECQTPTSPCVYDYSYSGGPSAKGIFASETITVGLTNGKEKQIHDSIIGCTESVQGRSLDGADGLMGLGTSPFSFTYKAAQSSNGGGFTYCLVDHLSDHTATSFFILGSPSTTRTNVPAGNMTYTKLFVGDPFGSFYGVDLVGISAGGVMLNIPSRVWDVDSGGGTIVDSGTSLTMLTAPAYDMVMEALKPPLLKFERVEVQPFQFCFNDSAYTYEMAPKLRFHFGDGAVFEPPAKSYIVSVGFSVSCIGFVSIPFPSNNIIGNIIQQNHLWQFDFFKRTIGFAPSQCI